MVPIPGVPIHTAFGRVPRPSIPQPSRLMGLGADVGFPKAARPLPAYPGSQTPVLSQLLHYMVKVQAQVSLL